MRLTEIKPIYVDVIPKEIEEGILYISKKYRTSSHLCACGCGERCVLPFDPGDDDWKLIENSDQVSLTPSIGNWNGEKPYHAHYYITENKIKWC